jgi:UDP-3-O-[3-hydroxymyristoyl] glucosamine N-acyltransferase
MRTTVQEIASRVGGRVIGEGRTPIEGITNFELPLKGHITFLQDGRHLGKLEATEIACLIVPPEIGASSKPIIQVKHPKRVWAQLLAEFFPAREFPGTVSPLAYVAATASLGARVTVEPFAVVGDQAEVGDDAVVRSYAFIGDRVKVGARTLLHPQVVLYDGTVVGAGVVIHAGSVIGADGFGYVATGSSQEKVPQVGHVVIEDDVEIGACVTIDRATVGWTRIGKGAKIDNLVQIAHNVTIGPHTVISAQSGISGSSKVGAHVTMGGKVGLGDHVEIGDWTMVGAGSGLPSGKKVPARQVIFGEPARPYHEARKQIAAQWRAAEMYEEIKRLRKRIEDLEKKLEETPKLS